MASQNYYQGAGNMAGDAFPLRYDPYESAAPVKNQGNNYTWPASYPSFDSSLNVEDFGLGLDNLTWPAPAQQWQPNPSYSIYPEEPLLPVGTDFSFQPFYNGYLPTYPQFPPQPPVQPVNTGAQLTSRRNAEPAREESELSSPSPAPLPTRRILKLRRKSKLQKRKMNKQAPEPVDLPGPLSTLVSEGSTPEAEVEKFVNRSVDTRLEEFAGYKDGRVRRPLNAFMLYRKAYQVLAKEYSDDLNHQNISKTCGASWRTETPECRERFAKFATTELENHRLAFPDYKYTPRKYEGTALDWD
ncbi:hypothetical protein F4810DRAFT_721760 [Camillea tinctor]|nr:hypothetical protein F4810DRAFT_721760 [Camillea tinctor]